MDRTSKGFPKLAIGFISQSRLCPVSPNKYQEISGSQQLQEETGGDNSGEAEERSSRLGR